MDDLLMNATSMNVTVRPQLMSGGRHLSNESQLLITFCYLLGISGNICALVILSRRETIRNKKQTLMLRCLACNDLIALLGSFILMYLQLYLNTHLVVTRWFCALRVMMRAFGLGSGVVAIVMAVERWLALTRPFVYQKHITYKLIKRSIFLLWAAAVLLTCLPFMGFGLYWDASKPPPFKCARYRNASSPIDIAYAFLFFTFGMTMSICIVCCNLLVVRVLCRMGERSVARISRTNTRKEGGHLTFNHTTPEELSFAKLMAILCIFFVLCWVPQMIGIILAQCDSTNKRFRAFYRFADICLSLNFALDPYIYVLFRRPHRRSLRRLLKPLCQSCREPPATDAESRAGSVRDSDSTKVTKTSESSRDTPNRELIPITCHVENHNSTNAI